MNLMEILFFDQLSGFGSNPILDPKLTDLFENVNTLRVKPLLTFGTVVLSTKIVFLRGLLR